MYDSIEGYPQFIVPVPVISFIKDFNVSFMDYTFSLQFIHYGFEEPGIMGRTRMKKKGYRTHTMVISSYCKLKSNIILFIRRIISFEHHILQFFADFSANPVQT